MSFDLASISKTKRARAPKVVIYGPSKIGKTTFGASAPNAVGILTEEGTDAIDTQAFPLCRSLDDVHAAIGVLATEEHNYENVFLDSLDWLEPLIHEAVCKRLEIASIEAAGYGKGYVEALTEWRTVLEGLDVLRNERNMGVICIAHDQIKKFDSPTTESYDTYSMKLHKMAAALFEEWADVIGFANKQVFTRMEDAGFNKKEAKATTSGVRMLYLNRHPAYLAGNRFSLPDMPLDWDGFYSALIEAVK